MSVRSTRWARASRTNGADATVDAAQKAGAVTLNYGVFINSLLSFVIVAWAVFLLVKTMNKLENKKAEEPPKPAATPPKKPPTSTAQPELAKPPIGPPRPGPGHPARW